MNKKDIEERIKVTREINKNMIQIGLDSLISGIDAGETLGKANQNAHYSMKKYAEQIQKKLYPTQNL